MSTTTTPATEAAPSTTTVTCDAPGCAASAPVAESGHIPAGWHTLVRELGARVDAVAMHFHSLECVLAHLSGPQGLDLQTIAGQIAPGHINVGDLVIPAQVRAQFGEVEGDVASMWRAVIALASDSLAALGVNSAHAAHEQPAPASEPAAEAAADATEGDAQG